MALARLLYFICFSPSPCLASSCVCTDRYIAVGVPTSPILDFYRCDVFVA